MTGPISIGQAGLNGRPHALYRFYDRSDVLLYVGITVDPGARFKKHAGDKPWWGEVANISVTPHESRAAALEAEEEAIRSENPLYNTVHNTFIAQGPVTPEQAVANFAEAVLSKLNIFGQDLDAYMDEADPEEYNDLPYQMPKAGAAALLAAEDESGGKITLLLGARHVVAQLDPELLNQFEQRAINNAKNWEIDTSGGLDEPEIMEGILVMVAAMLARQYLDTLDPAEANEWIDCAKTVYGNHDNDTLARMAAGYARQWKHRRAVPPPLCFGEGEHGARCPGKSKFDVQFTCDQGHLSPWSRYCGKHAEELKADGVTHHNCGADATVTACEPTQAPDWGWV